MYCCFDYFHRLKIRRGYVRFSGEMGGPNSMKLCTKLVDIPWSNISLLPFRFLKRVKRVLKRVHTMNRLYEVILT